MKEILVSLMLTLGAIFVLLSAIGLLRMPDLYTRMSTTTKANTLGIGLLLVAFSVSFFDVERAFPNPS